MTTSPRICNELNARSEAQFRKSLRLALAPQQLLAGGAAYEYAFIADPDGVLLELIRRRNAPASAPEVEDGVGPSCCIRLLWQNDQIAHPVPLARKTRTDG